MWPVDEFTYSVRQNTHGNLSTNVILGIILIAAVGDAATRSPTGSKLQRVPADLLDMWAICLLVVALVSLHLIHMQTHTHRLLLCTCVYTHLYHCVALTPPYTSLTFKCHTLRLCGGLVSGVRFLFESGLSIFPERQSPRPKLTSHHRKRQFV